jgi:hypothetical protein
MSTAIVTITCPWCSGRVEGLNATNVDQTVKCPYCRTELHVPRIGEVVHERVIREIIHEVSSAPEPDLNCMPSRRKNSAPSLIVAAVGFVVLLAMMCNQGLDTDHAIEDVQAQGRAEDLCRQRCDDSCASAGDKESKESYDADTERVMKDADVMLCTVDCQRGHDCIGTSPHERLHRQ